MPLLLALLLIPLLVIVLIPVSLVAHVKPVPSAAAAGRAAETLWIREDVDLDDLARRQS